MPAPKFAPAELDRLLTAIILVAPATGLGTDPPRDAITSPSQTLKLEAWTALLGRAREQGVTSLLYSALEVQNLAVPSTILETLQEQHRRSVLATASIYYELASLLETFNRLSIPIVVMKGAALAKWLYPDSALRPFGDLDLLLYPDDIPRAADVLRAQNYVSGKELAAGFRDSYYSEMAFTRTIPPRIGVDVHWNLFVPLYYRRAMDLDWFWQRTEFFAFHSLGLNQRALVFNPTAQLVHLAVHASLNHQHAPRLIWLYDLALLLYRKQTEIDFAAAAAYAHASQLARSIFDILTQMQETWHTRLASEQLELFRPHAMGLRQRIAFALTAAPRNEARVLNDALSLPRPADRARYALRHLFPDAKYMRQRYAIRSNALLPYYYARRLVETTRKFFRSVWSAVTHSR